MAACPLRWALLEWPWSAPNSSLRQPSLSHDFTRVACQKERQREEVQKEKKEARESCVVEALLHKWLRRGISRGAGEAAGEALASKHPYFHGPREISMIQFSPVPTHNNPVILVWFPLYRCRHGDLRQLSHLSRITADGWRAQFASCTPCRTLLSGEADLPFWTLLSWPAHKPRLLHCILMSYSAEK